ncbi:DnaJ domain-containing protein [Halomonas sp. HP20-15]|uniref:DnaJ domain-containing protein n=1 Tax=Halomonas sp. HP20-15 TaxID=3085901 RepID=UPI002980FBA9|nr:DnaJ domain-containing protein [Halomonas sp. HP20-15]MDW5378286.1 DnaJ domain-containing protein [Halomonas sp. HP20-15]
MVSARFSPFELLLLKSRNQTDTAALLLLAWVMVSKGNVLPEDKHYLETLAAGFRHGHDLAPLIEIAGAQDMSAIQLAAEVLQKDWWNEQSFPFLRQAIGLATSNGQLAASNNHVLRFLADLLGVAPAAFAQLFQEVAGRALESPEDPSRADYWQSREHTRQQQSQREQAREREREREREQQYSRQRQRDEQAERQRREHEEHREREEHAYQRHSYRQGAGDRDERYRNDPPPPGDRSLRALHVLGLDAKATRSDIKKAYRRLAQTHHPDRFYSHGERRMATASQRFQRIKNAYEYLMQDARFV